MHPDDDWPSDEQFLRELRATERRYWLSRTAPLLVVVAIALSIILIANHFR